MSIVGGLIGGGISALGGIASNVISAEYNKREAEKNRNFQTTERIMSQNFNQEEAEKNRKFQKEMRDTALLSSVGQAEKLGISPSLVLGQGSTALGGSQATSTTGGSGSTAHANFENPLAGIATALINTINEKTRLNKQEEMQEQRLKAQEEMQEDYFNHQEKMFNMKNTAIQNKNKRFKERNYTSKQLNSLFKDIKDIDFNNL